MRSIQEILFILSEIIETKILNEMRESNHFALMFDETIDCSVTEQLAIHGRYIDNESGALKLCYLKVIDILQPEIDALQDASTHTEMDTHISVCASTVRENM